jgi:dienelactone hydrolase
MTFRSVPLAAVLAVLAAPTAHAFDPSVEASNYSKGNERAAIYMTPEYQALLRRVSAENAVAADTITARDPERQFRDHLCQDGQDGCAGDARLYDWGLKGYGIVRPVLWTARSGATISGRVWATKAGPARRPGIVITNGSVQADEQLYWYAAQVLAKAGYVVLTWDPQGQGQSDTPGAGTDQNEGVPAQSDGRPFFDGTVDALDFFLSTPQRPFVPRKSCTTGTSHADKQARRVKAGLDAAYNPLWDLVDPGRIGLAGHSYGAAGVSFVAQSDPRVSAVVAWDNLGTPDPNQPFGGSGGGPVEKPCPADPSARTKAPITKPGLGLSADYFIPPEPNTSDPDPLAKSTVSHQYSKAGVDTGEIVIRGGTHYDFDWIPNPGFPATLRGADLISWYTLAWFDKYVKGDPTADDRLLSDRWRADAAEGAVDPGGDPNMFSFYYPSRLDVRRTDGPRVTCENLRKGCTGLVAKDNDGFGAEFDYLRIDTSPDGAVTTKGSGLPTLTAPPGATRRACRSRRVVVVHVARVRGMRLERVRATVGRRRVGAATRTRRVRLDLRGLARGRVRVVLRLTGVRGGRRITVTQVRVLRTCTARGR